MFQNGTNTMTKEISLLEEIKKQIKEDEDKRKKDLETFQIKQLLTIIGTKKKKIEELQKEVKNWEERLEKKDYLVPTLGSNGYVFIQNTLQRI